MNILDIRLYLRSIFLPMRVTLDSNDNSVTINKSLYKAMLQCDIKRHNRILGFRVGDRYAFTINPKYVVDAPFAQLQKNPEYRTVGFELLSPSVNSMMNYWCRPYGTIARNVRVMYKVIGGNRCFVICPPTNTQCRTINRQ